jgi:hypothetical protein
MVEGLGGPESLCLKSDVGSATPNLEMGDGGPSFDVGYEKQFSDTEGLALSTSDFGTETRTLR